MRLSLTGIMLLMASILAVAIFIADRFRETELEEGTSLTLVIVNSRDGDGLKKAFADEAVPTLGLLKRRGVTLLQAVATSPWEPSSVASILTGMVPSEHGLHRAHGWLSPQAETLPQVLSRNGFKTYAAVTEASPMQTTGVLAGFRLVETRPARETVGALKHFLEQSPPDRNRFVLVELDLDAFGGPRVLDKTLNVILDVIGGEAYLDRNVLAVAAPGAVTGFPEESRIDPTVPVLFSGAPLARGNGKVLLKALSLASLHDTLMQLCYGSDFNQRDGMRRGAVIPCEWVQNDPAPSRREVSEIPPLFSRRILFDDTPRALVVEPGRSPVLYDGDGIVTDSEDASRLVERYVAWSAALEPVEDWNISSQSGPALTRAMVARLGPEWDCEDYLGRAMHGVEHYRLAEMLFDSGYTMLALNEMRIALTLERNFPRAHFRLAQIHSSVDPDGGLELWREFLDRYGNRRDCREEAEFARNLLGSKAD